MHLFQAVDRSEQDLDCYSARNHSRDAAERLTARNYASKLIYWLSTFYGQGYYCRSVPYVLCERLTALNAPLILMVVVLSLADHGERSTAHMLISYRSYREQLVTYYSQLLTFYTVLSGCPLVRYSY